MRIFVDVTNFQIILQVCDRKGKIVMKNVLKKAIATLTATVSLVVGVCSLSASAYDNSASMVLRNIAGTPGNITHGTLTINSVVGAADYYTSFDFANGTSATLLVETTNAIGNVDVELNRNNRSATLRVEARYAYITFEGTLNNSAGESGVWSVSI